MSLINRINMKNKILCNLFCIMCLEHINLNSLQCFSKLTEHLNEDIIYYIL